MQTEDVFRKIEELTEKYLTVLSDICDIESPTAYKEGVDAVGRYILQLAEEKGWKTEVCRQDAVGDVVTVTVNADIDAAPLTVSGHMDTVHPVGFFKTPRVTRDASKIYGPGVADCKGGIAVALLAMDALSLCGFRGRPVQLILQSDEENNSTLSNKATIKYICEKAKGSVAFLNCEPGVKNTACLFRKGIVRYKFTIKGAAAHSALCYNGANAIAEAAQKILVLEKYKDPDGITCNCGLISGGTVANTVAEYCEFVADIRFHTATALEEIREAVRALTETSFVEGCSTTVEEISLRPEMAETEQNYALLDKLNRIFGENGLSEWTPRKANGGSDAAYITRCAIPCLDAVGIIGSKIHSINEYAEIASLAEAAKRIAAAAINL